MSTAGFTGVHGPARGAIVPTLVSREHYAAAAALWQIVMQVGTVLGPAIAGLLISVFSLQTVYVIDALTFGAAIIGALRMAPAPAPEVENPVGLVRSATDGFRYLRTAEAVKGTFAADLVAMIFGMPRALFPALGLGALGGSASTVGLLYAAPGAGGLIGAATTGWVGRIHRQGRAVVISILLWGVAIAGFGLSNSLPLAMTCLALAGAADVWSAVFRNTILQNFVADRFRGRLELDPHPRGHRRAAPGRLRVGRGCRGDWRARVGCIRRPRLRGRHLDRRQVDACIHRRGRHL